MWETGGGFFQLPTIDKVARSVNLIEEYCSMHDGLGAIWPTTKPSLKSQCPLYWQCIAALAGRFEHLLRTNCIHLAT